jgi:hypothetical protein
MSKNAIVSRDFWPHAGAIGEGLLKLAEHKCQKNDTIVFTMSNTNLQELYSKKVKNSPNVSFSQIKPITNSNSFLITRVVELFYFAFWLLFKFIMHRPNLVYVATNPPILVPFFVALYCIMFKKKYIYHLQDIHPESASLIVNFSSPIKKIILLIDNFTISRASELITLTDEMKLSILNRKCKKPRINIISNPGLNLGLKVKNKKHGFVFCGNAGRLQMMNILLPAIKKYLDLGGTMEFCFIGRGVYSKELAQIGYEYKNFSYLGYVDAESALNITSKYTWSLLPIDPRVLNFGYPSKIPTYLSAGCKIFSITSKTSSLAKWIVKTGAGINSEPEINEIIASFKKIENEYTEVGKNLEIKYATTEEFSDNIQSVFYNLDEKATK